MPQIDLGKIRFDWRGTWSNSTAYELNDVVTDGADVYVAIVATVPAGTALSNTSYWDVMVEGVTTAEIDAAIAALVDTAPDALNTLNELAAALGDDANFATTVTNSLAGKADTGHTHLVADVTDITATDAELNILDGATLTTTELNYVGGVTSGIQGQLDAKVPLTQPVVELGDGVAVDQAYLGKLITNSFGISMTVVAESNGGLLPGQQVDFLQMHTDPIVFTAGAGVTLYSKDGNLSTAAQYAPASLKCVATNTYVLVGDLGA
jgi:hypothetical protein